MSLTYASGESDAHPNRLADGLLLLSRGGALHEQGIAALLEELGEQPLPLWEEGIAALPLPEERAFLWRTLAARLPRAEALLLWERALVEGRGISAEYQRVEAIVASLVGMLPHLPEAPLADYELLGTDYLRLAFLQRFTEVKLPARFAAQLADAALALPYESQRADGISAIAPSLGAQAWRRVRTQVRAFEDPSARARALAALANSAPASERANALAEAAEVTVGLDSEWSRSDQIVRLASALGSAPNRVRRLLLETARAIPGAEPRLWALREVAQFLPASSQRSTRSLAFSAARSIENMIDRSQQLERLAITLTAPAQERAYRQSLDAMRTWVRTATSGHDQASFLIDYATQLPQHYLPEVLEMTEMIGDQWHRAALLCWHAANLPPENLDKVAYMGWPLDEPEGAARVLAVLCTRRTPNLNFYMSFAGAAARRIADEPRRSLVQQAVSALATLFEQGGTAEAIQAITAVGDPWWRALGLATVAPYLGPVPAQIALAEAQRAASAVNNEDHARVVQQQIEAARAAEATGSAAPFGLPRPGGPQETSPAPEESTAPEIAPSAPSADPLLNAVATFSGLRRRPAIERLVNTGFSSAEAPAEPLDPLLPLRVDSRHYFWLEVGPLVLGAADIAPEPLPVEHLPASALLQVALFALADRAGNSISLPQGADVGELRLLPDGTAAVERQPAPDSPLPAADPSVLQRRLLFPVRMPTATGTYSLRCNIYCQGTLVQSRRVRVAVRKRLRAARLPALSVQADYTLSRALPAGPLAALERPRLSLFLNANEEGTHSFFYFGASGDLKSSATFDEGAIQDLITRAREAYRRASWGTSSEWDERDLAHPYRYAGGGDFDTLALDLKNLAAQGYSMYSTLIGPLTGFDPDALAALEEALRTPGALHVAIKDSPRFILPAALIYDAPLDSALGSDALGICPEFENAFRRGIALDKTPCFDPARGCPSHGKMTVVCPSGFWGFRHQLGMPASGSGETSPEIHFHGRPQVVVGVSTDPDFVLRAAHEDTLMQMRAGGLEWKYGDKREDVLALLKAEQPHLVYFFCHGFLSSTRRPGIQVGSRQSPAILPDNITAYRINWRQSRPLVFINGCGTGSVEPEQAFDMVSMLLRWAAASGVIGTEITIFEPLARDFAERCLGRFLGGEAIGEAVRQARLSLLADGNPLGLVYIPFLLPSLRLVEQ